MAIRIVHDAAYNSHTEPLFKNAGVLPLSSLIEFFILQFVQRFVQGFIPISFNNTWITNAVRREDDYQLVKLCYVMMQICMYLLPEPILLNANL